MLHTFKQKTWKAIKMLLKKGSESDTDSDLAQFFWLWIELGLGLKLGLNVVTHRPLLCILTQVYFQTKKHKTYVYISKDSTSSFLIYKRQNMDNFMKKLFTRADPDIHDIYESWLCTVTGQTFMWKPKTYIFNNIFVTIYFSFPFFAVEFIWWVEPQWSGGWWPVEHS